jgi:hypothetical protein
MTTSPTNYFLLVYNLDTHEVQVEEWHDDDVGAAAAYSERERQYQDRDEIEVVLVGADSFETIKTTHSHYFVQRTGDLFEQLAQELLARD